MFQEWVRERDENLLIDDDSQKKENLSRFRLGKIFNSVFGDFDFAVDRNL